MARPDLQQPANQELRIMNEETLAKEKGSAQTVIRNSGFVIRDGKEPPQPTQTPQKPEQPMHNEPAFKPIVPLPTFIQTQFRTTQVNPQKDELRSTNYEVRKTDAPAPTAKLKNQEINKSENQPPNSTLANDPRIKSILSKFTTSSTQKPKPPAESPYKEKI